MPKLPKRQKSNPSEFEWESTLSAGPSTPTVEMSGTTINKLVPSKRDSPPVTDQYGEYKSDSQLYFTDKLHNGPKWSLWMTVVFLIPILNSVPLSGQRLTYINNYPVRCKIPDLENTNWTFDEMKDISSYNNSTSICYHYDYNYKNLSEMSFEQALNVTKHSSKPLIKRCTEFLSDIKRNGYTHKDEFSMHCTPPDKTLIIFVNIGRTVISLILGFVADIYGRKWTLIATHFILCLGHVSISLSPTYLFLIMSVIIAKSVNTTVENLTLILISETVNYRVRRHAVAGHRLGYGIGCFLHVLFYYHIRYWRYNELATTCTLLLPALTQWFLPESPHWLICSKRWVDLSNVLKDMNYPQSSSYIYPSTKPLRFASIRKNTQLILKPIFLRKLLLNTLLHGLVRIIYFIEYKRTYFTLDSEPVHYTLLGIAVIINTVVVPYILKRLSRPITICCCFLGQALFYCSFTMYQHNQKIVFLVIFLRLIILDIVFVVNRLLIIEMFPTKVRVTVLNFCSAAGFFFNSILSILQSYSNMQQLIYGNYVWSVYAVIMLVVAFICIFVKETGNIPLPDTELQAIIHF